ncbi:sugar phosphate isomerase/epimerase family protein [Caproiciproducens sp. CPB-2]|uniref:sugar phosphate isomerase/epimerase family protein n=1 Tax=Caproiciproducens sp. CPB-2 TaxID=3030017 RepID=UPI0023DA3B02|nr:sugar phosphate isomerase/epimerase family protein [Caproiciproducens sp. CPB-2]MDF1494545.1 sugar phosphate isomerase/epimerase [Caproiciproducens sp. CPB-2]
MKRCQIAGMNKHYRFYTIEDFFLSLQKIGIHNVELWSCAAHYFFDYREFQDPKPLLRKASSYGIKIICFTPEQSNPRPYNLASREPELREKTLNYYKNAIKVSCELECKRLVINGGWHFYSESFEDGWKRSVELLRQVVEFAQRNGVVLDLEPVSTAGPQLIKRLTAVQRILKEVNNPCLHVVADTTNLEMGGDSLQKYYEALGERLDHIHFVDGNPDGHLAWGDGTRDASKLIALLDKYHYTGYLSLEIEGPQYLQQPIDADLSSMKALEPFLQ